MLYRNKNLVFFATASALILLAINCKPERVDRRSKKESTPATDKLNISAGEAMVEDIGAALQEQGLPESQVATIKTGALAGIESSSTALFFSFGLGDKVDANDIKEAAPVIIQGAIKAMKDAKITDSTLQITTSQTISKSGLKALKGRMGKVTKDQKKKLPSTMTKSAVSVLDDAGLVDDTLSEAVGKVISGTISQLDDAGFEEDELGDIHKPHWLWV